MQQGAKSRAGIWAELGGDSKLILEYLCIPVEQEKKESCDAETRAAEHTSTSPGLAFALEFFWYSLAQSSGTTETPGTVE